jgi:addiction module HigA family antidote
MRIHPGETLKEMLEDRKIFSNEIAMETRLTFSEVVGIIDGEDSISGFIATELGKFFETGTQFWLNLQENYDEEEE